MTKQTRGAGEGEGGGVETGEGAPLRTGPPTLSNFGPFGPIVFIQIPTREPHFPRRRKLMKFQAVPLV